MIGRSTMLSLLVAAAGGVVWGWQFAREPFLIAPWIALVPLVLLLDRPRPWATGLVHGLVTWLTAIPWIAPTLVTFGHLPGWLSWLSLGLVAGYLGAYHALFAGIGARLTSRSLALALVGLPSLWVVLESTRGWLFGGFPWNLAAYAWIELPGALPLAAWIGPWGLSWLVVFANVGLALAFRRRSGALGGAVVLSVLLLTTLAGRFSEEGGQLTRGRPVRLVQPNSPIVQDPDSPAADEAYRTLLDDTRAACDVPALVVWPESAAWPFSYGWHPEFREAVEEMAQLGCPVLLNSPMQTDGKTFNSAVLAGPDGPLGRYDKRHLVPFGEHVPMGKYLPFLRHLARYAGDFTPASEVVLLPWESERLGVAICFEITFPGEVAELTQSGATALVTITNDAWYGDTWAPWQHYRAARFRAAENGRPLLRAALTGVSGVIDARGQEVQRLGVHEHGVIRARLTGRTELTLYTRAPWLVPTLAALVLMVCLVAARRGGSVSSSHDDLEQPPGGPF